MLKFDYLLSQIIGYTEIFMENHPGFIYVKVIK